jgi:hypothetical protein
MAKQSSVNLDITNNADGFDISGGTTARKLGITGGDVTIAGSGSAVVTFPTTSTTIAGLGITQSFSALQSFSAGISAAGGVTLAGTLQGTTANFTGLVSSDVGFSGAGTNLTNVAKLNTSNTFTSGSYLTVTGVGMFAGRTQVTGNSIIFTEGYDDGSTTLLGSPSTGSANTVTLPQTTGTVALTNSTVASFNGRTGAVTGASLGANTFTELNTFNAGVSASALTVSGGATFSGNVYLGDAATGVTAASNDFVRILAGTNSYGLWTGVAGIYQSRKNLSASTSGVICATPVVSIANYTTVELMVEYAEILSFSGGSPWACHKFVIVLTSDEEYGGVLSLSYTESITKNGSIATVPFTIDYDTGQNIEVTATVPANTSKFYVGWRFKTTVRVY